MPRNVSGTYSLYTPGNPVVPSTVITTTWANNTLSDLATAMTDSLSRSGQGGMSAPLQLAAGAIGAPGMTWTAETTSGWYRAGAGDFRYSVGGVDKLTITAALITSTPAFTVSGTLTASSNLAVTGNTLLGAATGGNQGAGTINAVGVYDDGVLLANQVGANPTATAGLTAINGVATTFMRSDGAPALSQAISPTWTGTHTWSGTATAINTTTASSTTGFMTYALQNDAGNLFRFALAGSANVTAFVTNGPTGPAGYFYTTAANMPISVGTNGTERLRITDSGVQLANGESVGYLRVPRSTTATTFAAADVGKCVAVSAAINIPISVFSAGDTISVYNDSAAAVNITISAGTLRLSGTTTTGTRSLAARGIATLWFNVGGATPEVIASGNIT